MINRKDYEFKEYGIHMVCGEQGSGKTTTVVYLLNKWKKLYPFVQISSNMDYKYQDGEINHWKDIVHSSNGVLGKIEVIDEIQTWFSSLQSKDFPPEMLQEVSQQRKQRKAIIGTAQIFSRMSKPLREQTHFIYLPMTLFGCLTIVRKSHIKYWNDEKQKFTQYTGMFFFVHNKELRDSFDTYKKIEKYSKDGFKSESEIIRNTSENIFLKK
jgi:energy-coupling factor transporter ATP-binding protein EcfA2